MSTTVKSKNAVAPKKADTDANVEEPAEVKSEETKVEKTKAQLEFDELTESLNKAAEKANQADATVREAELELSNSRHLALEAHRQVHELQTKFFNFVIRDRETKCATLERQLVELAQTRQ
jgi:hypothetical protein